MRHIVLDTNCLLMIIPRISPYRVVWDSFLDSRFVLCVSNEIVEEYSEILSNKLGYHIAANVISTILFSTNVKFVTPYYKFSLITSDVDDNKFVDCAIAAGADYIVSEDAHFRVLDNIPFPHVNLLRLKEFAAIIG
ncbi:MAG: putative toxin-antitoxin system toxin component, PIN family [Prevotella sp.]|nr:putative toxin-antitoxin system toxin component, PIN family [Prevotella sp.]